MISYWIKSDEINNDIFIPKYYNPEIQSTLEKLSVTHDCMTVKELVGRGIISHATGHEIGKGAYGTGDIPFVRTSDISNWEIKAVPKQGVDRKIYEEYSSKQDVREGDILLVRDGTYLIGSNCFITQVDKELIYQSHIIKIRVNEPEFLAPELLFLLLNSEIVQSQIRSFQFTADIIDTIGQRFNELVIPIPKSESLKAALVTEAKQALSQRIFGKALIKQSSKIIEEILLTNSVSPLEEFVSKSLDDIADSLSTETVTSEFGGFNTFFINSAEIKENIFIPKYYDPTIDEELESISSTCELITMGELKKTRKIEYFTGDEIGKMAYGTGEIPFIRTSDFSNWEIKHDPKQGISEAIYEEYSVKQDVRENDILLVRDGTYLVGTSCLVTSYDSKSLFCGGLYKIRSNDPDFLNPFLFLGLLNSYIVKRQIRTKQFTRDVIDTIGNRIDEVIIPIPKSVDVKKAIAEAVKKTIDARIESRENISTLSKKVAEVSAG
ncbi:hypothetical protein [Brevibacillus choshinensis]|uniref:hypothetical protein n=1 Tax=Brevibacillus choshinensis TaxID=54911 RepID=UPI002E1BAE7B|nr:hypothetical protein [Brevibacillus choshinensis]